MSEAAGAVLSVRGTASRIVAPDSAVLTGSITAVAHSKVAAVGASAAELHSLTSHLRSLGGVALQVETERASLTWSAQSATSYVEREHSKETGRSDPTGRVVATVSLMMAVRDFALLEALGRLLAAHADLAVHQVGWYVDADNPAWPGVRAAAIHAAIGKGRDYAGALGGALDRVEHIADAGLLGGGDDHGRARQLSGWSAQSARSGGGQEPDAPSLDPVPQELSATIEARFVATGISLSPI